MNIQHIILCLIAAVGTMHAAESVNNNEQVRNAMHVIIGKASKNIDNLDVENAERDIKQLNLLADKTQDEHLKKEIKKQAQQLDKSLKFNMHHRHGEMEARKRK